MNRLTLLFAVAALPAAAAEQLSLAAPGLTVVGIPADRADFFSEHLAGRLTEAGARVSSAKAIEQLLGFERQKQLLGCGSSSSSCFVELANALGTDGIVFGEIAKVGSSYQVNLKVLAAGTARVISNSQQRATSEEGVLDALDQAGRDLATAGATAGATALNRTLVPLNSASSGPSLRTWGIVSMSAGAVSLGVGIALLSMAAGNLGQIPSTTNGVAPISLERAQQLAAQGSTFQTAGWTLVGVAVAGVGAGVTLFLLGGKTPVQASVLPNPHGGSVWVGVGW